MSPENMNFQTAQQVKDIELTLTCISDSVQFCWEQGGYLAEITSDQEQQAIGLFLLNGADFWLGLADIEEEGW